MRYFDFSSWQGVLASIGGLLLITLFGMGIRLLMMMTIQQRRERQNRQINERLKALIAAYKTLGGSFTGNLAVNPSHLRDLRRARIATPAADEQPALVEPARDQVEDADGEGDQPTDQPTASERARRIRDAVEASLSDIILFGTDEQVKLASQAAQDMVAGRTVHLNDLVVSLRAYIREALDLTPIPESLGIPSQGPARPSSSSGRGGGGRDSAGGGSRGGGGGGMGAMGGGMALGGGMGMGLGMGSGHKSDDPNQS